MYFDNIRGKILSELPFLEMLLTEPLFPCRALYIDGSVNVERCVFAATSNGAVLSPDLASCTSMLPVSGAEQFIDSGARIGLRPLISASGAYCRLVRPAPCCRAGRDSTARGCAPRP